MYFGSVVGTVMPAELDGMWIGSPPGLHERLTADPRGDHCGCQVVAQLRVLPAQGFKLIEESSAGAEVAEESHGGFSPM